MSGDGWIVNFLACESSRPSSFQAEWRFARGTSAIYCRKFYTDDISANFVILHKSAKKCYFRLIENRHLVRHDTPRELCTKPQISYMLTHAGVLLWTSSVQNILEIPATDEIHMEDRNHGHAWTKPNNATVIIRPARKQLHQFELCGARMTKEEINLYIELEKHKLEQIAARNIGISLDKRIAFSK